MSNLNIKTDRLLHDTGLVFVTRWEYDLYNGHITEIITGNLGLKKCDHIFPGKE